MASSSSRHLLLGQLLAVLVTVFCFSCRKVQSQGTVENIPVPSIGPHNIAFDLFGRGPYTGVSDGRILRYVPSRQMFVDFAYTSSNRTKELCDGVNTTDLLPTCGRPLGMEFHYLTGHLFIVDATLGLFRVGPAGGRATSLATEANGTRFRFAVGLEIHQQTGYIYFTDASTSGGIDQIPYIVSIGDATGRVMRYNQITKKVTILVSGLSGAAGVAISQDGSYLMLTEFIGSRIRRFWLQGPKKGTLEILMNITIGTPDNIHRTDAGDFWVALTSPTGQPEGIRIDGDANILERLTFSPDFAPQFLAEVLPYRDRLYLGTLAGPFLGVYRRASGYSAWSSI